MIWQTLNLYGAIATRPGTASRGRSRYFASANRLAMSSAISILGVIKSLQGGQTP